MSSTTQTKVDISTLYSNARRSALEAQVLLDKYLENRHEASDQERIFELLAQLKCDITALDSLSIRETLSKREIWTRFCELIF